MIAIPYIGIGDYKNYDTTEGTNEIKHQSKPNQTTRQIHFSKALERRLSNRFWYTLTKRRTPQYQRGYRGRRPITGIERYQARG